MTAFPKKNPSRSSPGFTLIELLVVVAILAVLVVIVLARLSLFGRQVDLEAASQHIISTLRLARSQTLASEEEANYGVHFETSKYVLFKGSVYDPVSLDNKEYTLTAAEIYEINLAGGGSDVIFNRVRGTTNESGNVKVRLVGDPIRAQTILISAAGQVSLEQTVAASGARIVDTRHLHFEPCPSIRNSTTLTLVFSVPGNPDVVNNISMASYFDAGKTVFDWQGTTDVYGDDETIRMHTHFLDAGSSIISIHRDRRENTIDLEIRIDGISLVSYDGVTGDAVLGDLCTSFSVQ